jgi:hypothetical protein
MKIVKKYVRTGSKGQEYYKYDLGITPSLLKDLKWDENTKIIAKISGKKLIIEKV